ncbi:uncharacterized protein LOC107273807 isoform X2 [Cephus cinctus]|uniref:Uncharacterized protein LOC107273807 isoform X2 n=1 Tax=Cephus cinctus TaxID=211228 RepID=A0AAJ7W705_CEPCN|nr:uncharacterized protein LOC107273807 isoform X2 [Cephus cinctus]
MAVNSPGPYTKSPKSPRQLPQLPISNQRSPTQFNKSPSTPRVFEFPSEYYPETPNTNFDFEDFGRVDRSPSYLGTSGPKSPKSPNDYNSPGQKKDSVFQFCKPHKTFGKTLSYPPKSPISPCVTSRSPSSLSFGQKSPKHFDRRRNSCFNFGLKSPMSPTIVTSSSGRSPTGPKYPEVDKKKAQDTGSKYHNNGPPKSCRVDMDDNESPKVTKIGGAFNRSQGCLNDKVKPERTKATRNISRRSTSDLTDLGDAETEITILSSPRRRGSMKGGLAYLASRRGSRDSQVSNVSNLSNEDVGPLNFNAHPRGRQRRTSNFLELPVPDHIRARVHSLPEKAYNPRAGDDLYRLREFSITHKGVVNRGDSIISRRSRSNTSVNSSRNSNVSGERSPFEGSCCSGQGGAAESLESDVEDIPKYRVILLGDSGVGKTALVSQFMTSEYMNTYDASLDDEFGEKTVSILLDGEESELTFIDHPHIEMSIENSLSTYEPHACIVVYSIVSRDSFQVAEEMLNYLWREHYTQERTVIVVGNKADLARSRTIDPNEGKQLATSRECKFIETSSGIQHNVDELLVGVLKQIRLRETRDKKLRRRGSKGTILSKLHGILDIGSSSRMSFSMRPRSFTNLGPKTDGPELENP